MSLIPEWHAWGFAAAVAVALLGALVARALMPGGVDRLRFEHVAAAAIIGVLGWESLIQVPGNFIGFMNIVAGIDDLVITPLQVFVVAGTAWTLAMFVAVIAILRRRVWGMALGVGVGLVRVVTSVLGVVSLTGLTSQGMPDDQLLWLMVSIGLQAVPGVVIVALLLWPLRRPAQARPVADGITDVDPDLTIEDASELATGSS